MTVTPNRIEQVLATFTAHPSTVATYKAIQATQEGFALIYRMERDQQFGRSVAGFFFDIARLILWPLLALTLKGLSVALNYLLSTVFHDVVVNAYIHLRSLFERKSNVQKVADAIAAKGEIIPGAGFGELS